jgi:hypothetical protein
MVDAMIRSPASTIWWGACATSATRKSTRPLPSRLLVAVAAMGNPTDGAPGERGRVTPDGFGDFDVGSSVRDAKHFGAKHSSLGVSGCTDEHTEARKIVDSIVQRLAYRQAISAEFTPRL